MNNFISMFDPEKTVQRMALLYELALSIGESLDLVENCDRFLKVLMGRKNFDYAAVWIRDTYTSCPVNNAPPFILVYANPEFHATDKLLEAIHPMVSSLEDKDYLAVNSDTHQFKLFCTEKGISRGKYIIIPLGSIGILKLFTGDQNYIYDDNTARYFRNILTKFTVSLAGCISHDKLALLIHGCKQNELELTKIHEELEQRVLKRTRELVVANEALQAEIVVRKDTERRLHGLHTEFQALVVNAPDIIVRIDRNMRYLYANPAIEALVELPAEWIVGKSCDEIEFSGSGQVLWQEEILTVLMTGQEVRYESEFTDSSGIRSYQTHLVPEFGADGVVKTVLGISRDITKQKQLEKEMAQLDRFKLIGEMAASIGHEVRNPMTTVRGYLQLYQLRLQGAKDQETFGIMIEEIDRANSIITEFLSLSQNRAINLQQDNLNTIIQAIFPLLQADGLCRGNNIRLELGQIADLLLDVKEIRQCILNIVCNAWEAMPDGGTVCIRTFMERDFVVLSVADQGSGIAPHVLDRLGTPFLTTKERGTGLGIAICYSVAARHKAKIEVQSGKNGTTFIIRFPSLSSSVIAVTKSHSLYMKEGKVLIKM